MRNFAQSPIQDRTYKTYFDLHAIKKRANETDRLRMIQVNGQNVFLRIQTKPSIKTIKALLTMPPHFAAYGSSHDNGLEEIFTERLLKFV